MKTVTLSGWGQPHDALFVLAPDALHIDYASAANVNEAIEKIAIQAYDAHCVIGWSLGAQLAVRAIAGGYISPKRLLLIAPPFQFVADREIPHGMKPDLYEKFADNYKNNPARTLKKAWELLVKDDSNEEGVRGYIAQQNPQNMLAYDWKRWLDELEAYSCKRLDFSAMPPTLIVHGDKDVVISIEQSRHFANLLPDVTLHTIPGCGHAPHWHAPEKIREWMKPEHV